MAEGRIEQSGIGSQNNIIDLASERQKRTEKRLAGAPTAETSGKLPDTSPTQTLPQEPAPVIGFDEARRRRDQVTLKASESQSAKETLFPHVRVLPKAGEDRADIAHLFTQAGLTPLTDQEWEKRQQMAGANPQALTDREWQAVRDRNESLTIGRLLQLRQLREWGKEWDAEDALAQAGKGNVVDIKEEGHKRDQAWIHSLFRKRDPAWQYNMFGDRKEWKLTDQEWQRVLQIDPNIYHSMRLTNIGIEAKRQAGDDRALYERIFNQELDTLNTQTRQVPKDTLSREEFDKLTIEAGYSPLSDEDWQRRDQMKTANPRTVSPQEWRAWEHNPASRTVEYLTHQKENERIRQERFVDERKRREAIGWTDDLGDLNDSQYVHLVLKYSDRHGLDPRRLTPEERTQLRRYYRLLTPEEMQMPRDEFDAKFHHHSVSAFTPEERHELLTLGRTLSVRERIERGLEPDYIQRQELQKETPPAITSTKRQREQWETSPRSLHLSEKDFLAFQQWFWSLPLDVVIDLWERAPKNLRPELEPPDILQVIAKLYGLLRDTVKALLTESSQTKP